MYLDFISDIAKAGDAIRITCNNEVIEGKIVKITSRLVAVKVSDGTLVFKKDEEILDVALNPVDENKNTNEAISEISTPRAQNEISKDITYVTTGRYDDSWGVVDKKELLKIVDSIRKTLNKSEKNTIISNNAIVREVIRKSFRVSTDESPKINVDISSVIEVELINELMHFSIGDTLPVVIYYHVTPYFESTKVYLTLLPNNIEGYVELLKKAIIEDHYREAKSLCYFLLSQTPRTIIRNMYKSLILLLKPVKAFIREHKTKIDTPTKISKNYKEIERQLNELIKRGNHEAAISMIDELLNNTEIDNKYKSSLLLRKAQAFSSLTDYANAKQAYLELVLFKESTDGDPKNLSHLYTELARLQAMDSSGYDKALEYTEKALLYNSENKYAATLAEQIKSGSISYTTIPNKTNVNPTSSDEDKVFLLDSEESKLGISKMIDIDIREHRFTNKAIIANGGTPTALIAKAIYEEAKMTRDVDLSQRYPVYLEAAKAFSELPVGSYDSQDYFESVAYYAILKGNSLYIRFKKLLADKKASIEQLTHIKDSACNYYIESLNLLSSIESHSLLTILGNYLKMNITLANIRNGKEQNITGKFNHVFFSCTRSKDIDLNTIAWSTIVAVGTASSSAWNNLSTIPDGTRGLYGLMTNPAERQSIYKILNAINIEQVDTSLLPGDFIKRSFQVRKARNKQLADVMSLILKTDFNLHLLDSLLNQWDLMPPYLDLMNETEMETKSSIDSILLIIKPYLNRNQVERTNILIQVQSKIDEQLSFINENTTYYGRTFFYPLLNKWKKTIMSLLEQKIADTMPQLEVVADPPYIVDVKGDKVINLIIKNEGESTAEGCIMEPTITDLKSNSTFKGKNTTNKEIPAGSYLEIPMKLPSQMCECDSVSLSMSISAIYQSKNLEPKVFDFTIEKEPLSSLKDEDILWNDARIPVEQMFKGRKQIIDKLVRHYTSIEKDKPYILYGLTRTGKSSILKYLKAALDSKVITIDGNKYSIATFYWDLSQASSFGNAADMWEYLLYDQLYDYLDAYIGSEGVRELGMSEHPRAKDFNNALSFLHKKMIYPMFFVDEFSFIKVMMDNHVVNPAFLHTLRQFSFEGKAGFIYAGTYDVDALLEDSKYGITGQLVGCKREQISEIDRQSAEELIQVLGDKLRFTEDAVNHIHLLSGDVPYFIQMICKYCGLYALENKRSIIGYPELEYIVKILTGEIEQSSEISLVKSLPENVFQNNMFSPADPKEVNVLISSIVYFNRFNREKPRGVSMMELQELWATKKITSFRQKMAESIELLIKKKVLKDDKDEDLPVYSLTVDLFRRWWCVHHPDIDLEIDTIL